VAHALPSPFSPFARVRWETTTSRFVWRPMGTQD